VRQICVGSVLTLAIADRGEPRHGGLSCSRDQKQWIAYDGSFHRLPQSIQGSHIRTEKVGETLLQLYRCYGDNFVDHIEGCYAIAIWDGSMRTVLLARDPIGSKPLFYTIKGGRLTFASKISGVLSPHNQAKEPNWRSLDAFLTYGYVPMRETMFRGIRQVPPAHTCVIGYDMSCREKCNGATHRPLLTDHNLPAWSTHVRELMREALETRMTGASRLGFLLSGGADTAVLVGGASHISGSTLRTYTLGFPDCPHLDERQAARQIAAFFHTQHHEVTVDSNCIEELPNITKHAGCPVGNPAALISHALFRQIASEVDEVITGDGGNEIFGGTYKYHQVMHYLFSLDGNGLQEFIKNIGQKVWRHLEGTGLDGLFQKLSRLYFRIVNRKLESGNRTMDESKFIAAARHYIIQVALWDHQNRMKLYNSDIQQALGSFTAEDLLLDYFDPQDDAHPLQQLISVRTNSFIPYDVMSYVEYNAIANDIFPLFPLLDRKLVDFMLRVPYEYIYGRGWRYFMEMAMSDTVVPAYIFRRPHMGFRSPVETWLKTKAWRELVHDCLSREAVRRRGLFQEAYVQELVEQFYRGRKYLATEHKGKVQTLADTIWSLLAVEIWFQE